MEIRLLDDKKAPPLLSARSAAALSIAFTALYVLPFYISSTTRPSPTLSRDAPSVIRARIRFVTTSVCISSLITAYLLSERAYQSAPTILHTFGLYPVDVLAIASSTLLTSLLFAGPLFEKAVVESGWRTWIQATELKETLASWIGWRNFIAGPVTEEILFRSVLVSLHAHTRPPLPLSFLIFVTPLYFGVAHVHHFYEYKLTHPQTPLLPAVLRSLIQFAYTTIFGWYATFLFLRTGSLWTVVLIHIQCNWIGLPRVWGRVRAIEIQGGVVGGLRGKEDSDSSETHRQPGLSLIWTLAYYLLLFGGAFAWWRCLWPLSASPQALIEFQHTNK